MGSLINYQGTKKDRAEWWLTMKMLKNNIDYDRETNNLLSLRKEKDLFNYVVTDVRHMTYHGPTEACTKH